MRTVLDDEDDGDGDDESERSGPSFRKRLHLFLEARTVWGRRFEAFIMVVIFITVTEVDAKIVVPFKRLYIAW